MVLPTETKGGPPLVPSEKLGLKEGPFSPTFVLPVGKPGLKGVSQPRVQLISVLVSQTYYPEHILGYGRREDLLLSYRGFWLFLDRLIGGGDGGGLSTALSPGLRSGDLDP